MATAASLRGVWPQLRFALRQGDVLLGIGVLAILVVLILPLPGLLLDLCLAISITLAVLILLTALFIERPLEFSAFPTVLLIANGHETKRAKPGARVDRAKLRQIDLHWHDLRHEGACRLLAEHVDIRTIQLMLGHADIKQTQRYLNITDEELRKAMTGVWERRRRLRAVGQ